MTTARGHAELARPAWGLAGLADLGGPANVRNAPPSRLSNADGQRLSNGEVDQ
jgi:hypothetical protein